MSRGRPRPGQVLPRDPVDGEFRDEERRSHEHYHGESTPELRIKVERGQRGGYGWEIGASAPGHDVDVLLSVVEEADEKLRERFDPNTLEPKGPRAA